MRLPIWSRLTDRFLRPFEGLEPVETVPIDYELKNGVTLEAAHVYRNGVVVTWVNPSPDPHSGAVALPANVERVELGRSGERARRDRLRELGMAFDAPVLTLRTEKGWRFRIGDTGGGTDDEVFRGRTTFRVSAARVGPRLNIRCAGERITVRIPPG
jgi:hypothetical protein